MEETGGSDGVVLVDVVSGARVRIELEEGTIAEGSIVAELPVRAPVTLMASLKPGASHHEEIESVRCFHSHPRCALEFAFVNSLSTLTVRDSFSEGGRRPKALLHANSLQWRISR